MQSRIAERKANTKGKNDVLWRYVSGKKFRPSMHCLFSIHEGIEKSCGNIFNL